MGNISFKQGARNDAYVLWLDNIIEKMRRVEQYNRGGINDALIKAESYEAAYRLHRHILKALFVGGFATFRKCFLC